MLRDDIRAIRVLVASPTGPRRLCKVEAGSDGSLYVFPYGPAGRFACGRSGLAENEITVEVDLSQGVEVDGIPKLSLHRSGQVHVRLGQDYLAGPPQVPKLSELRGEHIISVVASRFDGLPAADGSLLGDRVALAAVVLGDLPAPIRVRAATSTLDGAFAETQRSSPLAREA